MSVASSPFRGAMDMGIPRPKRGRGREDLGGGTGESWKCAMVSVRTKSRCPRAIQPLTVMSQTTTTPDFRKYDTASRFVQAASIRLSGRTLRRWCDDNSHLAEGLGRIQMPGKDLFDLSKAPRFREIWIEAERKRHADHARAETDAARKIRHVPEKR